MLELISVKLNNQSKHKNSKTRTIRNFDFRLFNEITYQE